MRRSNRAIRDFPTIVFIFNRYITQAICLVCPRKFCSLQIKPLAAACSPGSGGRNETMEAFSRMQGIPARAREWMFTVVPMSIKIPCVRAFVRRAKAIGTLSQLWGEPNLIEIRIFHKFNYTSFYGRGGVISQVSDNRFGSIRGKLAYATK